MDPFAAAVVCAEALGPVRFDGWDADGEPVGRAWATPWLQCAGNAEEQCSNTWRPVVTMLREGPLAGTAGLDVGETRINLPSGGRIEPVSASSRARQGARVTFVSITEPQLMTETSGGLKLATTLWRNLGGMDGRWMGISNAYDPSERSVTQRVVEARDPHVYVDYRPPRKRVDLGDENECLGELAWVYGDSAHERGGWVRLSRLLKEVKNSAFSEGEIRRYYFNEVSVGSKDAVDMLLWTAQGRPRQPLEPGERVALGFHGSQTLDATSLCASRLSDGRIFHLRTWERPFGHVGDWQVPRQEVHDAVAHAFDAFDVTSMMCTPHGWQTEVDTWAGAYDKNGETKVLELWLNSEMRMDKLLERFLTAHRGGEVTHDGSDVLLKHAAGAALAAGKRRPAAEEREPGQPDHYLRVVRKSSAQSISAFVAGLLAYEARGWSIEHGELVDQLAPSIW